MAAYDEALQYIIDDTGRPDMQAIILRRIQRAVVSLHRIDFWKKDLVEQLHVFQYNQAVQIVKKALFPRIRAIGYMRKFNGDSAALYDPTLFSGAVGSFFGEMNPQNALDGYGYDRRNKFYETEDSYKINSSENIQQVLIGWFKDPLINPIDASDSWILRDYPSLVAAHVKRRVFKDIGKDEESRSSEAEYQDELLRLQANCIRAAVLQQPG